MIFLKSLRGFFFFSHYLFRFLDKVNSSLHINGKEKKIIHLSINPFLYFCPFVVHRLTLSFSPQSILLSMYIILISFFTHYPANPPAYPVGQHSHIFIFILICYPGILSVYCVNQLLPRWLVYHFLYSRNHLFHSGDQHSTKWILSYTFALSFFILASVFTDCFSLIIFYYPDILTILVLRLE